MAPNLDPAWSLSPEIHPRGEAASTQFRMAVTSSTTWVMAGAGIIGVAVLFMVAAVVRFGRR